MPDVVFLSISSSDSEVEADSFLRGGGMAPRAIVRVGGGGRGVEIEEGLDKAFNLEAGEMRIASGVLDERREDVDAAFLEYKVEVEEESRGDETAIGRVANGTGGGCFRYMG
jgi:hypothetical protein